jgi:hypothetical protein
MTDRKRVPQSLEVSQGWSRAPCNPVRQVWAGCQPDLATQDLAVDPGFGNPGFGCRPNLATLADGYPGPARAGPAVKPIWLSLVLATLALATLGRPGPAWQPDLAVLDLATLSRPGDVSTYDARLRPRRRLWASEVDEAGLCRGWGPGRCVGRPGPRWVGQLSMPLVDDLADLPSSMT